MEDDLYNPFCIDGIDPLSLPSTSRESIHHFEVFHYLPLIRPSRWETQLFICRLAVRVDFCAFSNNSFEPIQTPKVLM